jgi:Mrp family chromosome partitioning ATPase
MTTTAEPEEKRGESPVEAAPPPDLSASADCPPRSVALAATTAEAPAAPPPSAPPAAPPSAPAAAPSAAPAAAPPPTPAPEIAPPPAAPCAPPRRNEPLVCDLLAAAAPVRALLERDGPDACALAGLRQKLFPGAGLGPRFVLVVGARAGSGATTIAAALAAGSARALEEQVTLVVANLARPSAGRALGLGPAAALAAARGLLEAAAGASLEDVLAPTTLASLALVGPGRSAADGFEVLASRGTARLFETLRARAGRTIVDCAPVLERADALALLAHADQVVLVARAGRTPRRDVEAALASLGAARAVALVVNAEVAP